MVVSEKGTDTPWLSGVTSAVNVSPRALESRRLSVPELSSDQSFECSLGTAGAHRRYARVRRRRTLRHHFVRSSTLVADSAAPVQLIIGQAPAGWDDLGQGSVEGEFDRVEELRD